MNAEANSATQTPGPQTIGSKRLILIGMAWLATLAVSRLPQIILQEGFGIDACWIHWLWTGTLIALLGLSFVWTAVSTLRGYFIVMLAIVLATTLLDPLIRQTALWPSWFEAGQSAIVTLLAERVLIVLEALLVVGVLLLMGLKRGDFFLVKGQMDAPARGVRLPGMPNAVSWRVFGPVLAILLSILYVLFFASAYGVPRADAFAKAMPLLPFAFLAAVLNSFGEEMMYRAAPLSQLLPLVGAGQALLMTSLWFGLGHFYGGIPSGMAGLVGGSLLAMLFGKAMLDTRGIVWPWIIHFLADAVIYNFLAIAALNT